MHLTKSEQQMLDGGLGEAAQQSMEILVALAKIYEAEKMIPITSAQIAGVSYKTIGDAGLEYLQGLAAKGAKVHVPSFLNPAGMDIAQWKEMKIPEDFAKKQLAILDAYFMMGIMKTCTCTPYFIGIRPKKGEHIAWAESSAISFANSVLGARTNREGGPSALAAAICGVTPYYGLHKEENRVAKLVVDVECELKSIADFSALGCYVGEIAKDSYPAFKGVKSASEEQLKVLGASMAATGSVPLYFVEGITPEYAVKDEAEKIIITEIELKETKAKLDTSQPQWWATPYRFPWDSSYPLKTQDPRHKTQDSRPQLVTLGCPHASLKEIEEVARLVFSKKPTCEFWICTSRKIKEEAGKRGYVRTIEQAGGRVVADTCMVVCPLEQMGYCVTGTDSGKAAKYLPSLCRQRVVFGDLEDILYR